MTFDKSIQFDRITGDFRAELNGKLIGYYSSYHTAEVQLDQVVFDALIYNTVYDPPIDIPDEYPDPTPGGPPPPEFLRSA